MPLHRTLPDVVSHFQNSCMEKSSEPVIHLKIAAMNLYNERITQFTVAGTLSRLLLELEQSKTYRRLTNKTFRDMTVIPSLVHLLCIMLQ